MAAVNIDKEIVQYSSDLGVSYNNLGFKIKEGYQDILDIYDNRQGGICGVSGLFKPRQLEGTFITENGIDKVLFPVPTKGQVPGLVSTLLNSGAICVNYFGERWTRIPGALLGSASFNPTAQILASPGGERTTGSASYIPDSVTSTLIVGVQFESEPDNLSNAIQSCLLDFTLGGFCNENSGISPRKLVFKARRANGKPGQFVIRSVVVSGSDPNDIKTCAAALSTNFVCVGYEGEIYRNLQNITII